MVALIFGILDFISLCKSIFESPSCNIDFCCCVQRKIGYVKQNVTIFHLLHQIIQQCFRHIDIVGRQWSSTAKQSILLYNRPFACCYLCKLFGQNVLCWNNYKPPALALQHTRDTEVSHIHITIIQKIVGFFVIVFASFGDFFFIERTLRRGDCSPLPQIKDVVNNAFQIITRVGGMTPQGKLNSAQFRGTCALFKLQHDCQKPS